MFKIKSLVFLANRIILVRIYLGGNIDINLLIDRLKSINFNIFNYIDLELEKGLL